jgi:hypothetical protein
VGATGIKEEEEKEVAPVTLPLTTHPNLQIF